MVSAGLTTGLGDRDFDLYRVEGGRIGCFFSPPPVTDDVTVVECRSAVVWLLGFEEAGATAVPLPVEPVLTMESFLALSSPLPPPPPAVTAEDKNLLRAGIVGCGLEMLDDDVADDDDEFGAGVCCCCCWTFGKFNDDSES